MPPSNQAHRPRLNARGQRGFTIIELVVALAVTAIGLAGLLSMHSTTVRANRSSAHSARATSIAEHLMEELRGLSVDQITTQFGGGALPISTTLADATSGPHTYRRRLSATEVTEDPDLVRLRVDIEWTEAGASPGTEGGRYDHRISLELVRTKLELL